MKKCVYLFVVITIFLGLLPAPVEAAEEDVVMFVRDMFLVSIKPYQGEIKYTTAVTIMDTSGQLVKGARVYLDVTITPDVGDPVTYHLTAATNLAGNARFSWTGPSGLVVLCVTNVAKRGISYDPALNYVTCISFTGH